MSRLQDVENLLRAFSARDLDAIRALAGAGVAIDSRGGGSLTALMRAVLRATPTTAEWLLAAGADPDARADDGKTALDFARDLGRQDLVELLIAAGATDTDPWTESLTMEPPEKPPLAEMPSPAETPPPPETPPPAETAPRLDPSPVTVVRRSTRTGHETPDSDHGSDTVSDLFDDRFDDRRTAGPLR